MSLTVHDLVTSEVPGERGINDTFLFQGVTSVGDSTSHHPATSASQTGNQLDTNTLDQAGRASDTDEVTNAEHHEEIGSPRDQSGLDPTADERGAGKLAGDVEVKDTNGFPSTKGANEAHETKSATGFNPKLQLVHNEHTDPSERSRRASQIDWLSQQSKEYERRTSVVKGVDNIHITEDTSDPKERTRRASQVDWLKRESQIDPHDTSQAAAAAQRERRPSKYPNDPFLGNINETASQHNKAKHWKFSDGDFGLGLPKKPSNAEAQGYRRDGSYSGETSAPGPRGLFPNERRSIDANVTSDHDAHKKWSFRDGDFKFGMPKKPSNGPAQGFRRDGSISYEDGLPGPRGLFPNERASIDANVVSKHDKSKKWSFGDGDFRFGVPRKPSNAQAQGLPGPYTK